MSRASLLSRRLFGEQNGSPFRARKIWGVGPWALATATMVQVFDLDANCNGDDPPPPSYGGQASRSNSMSTRKKGRGPGLFDDQNPGPRPFRMLCLATG